MDSGAGEQVPARVLVAQLGARRHYAVPGALHRAGVLELLVTDASSEMAPWKYLDDVVPERFRTGRIARLVGRRVPEVPSERVRGLPRLVLSGAYRRRRHEELTRFWARRNAAFCQGVVARGLGLANCVYAFNGAALEIFQAAKRAGLSTVLDQTAAPWRWNSELLREESRKWPGWEDEPGEVDLSGELIEREEAEWALADRIVCGSGFCRNALIESGVPERKIEVVEYPFPAAPVRHHSRRRVEGGPLRVLFVGTLQLRKGVQYLYQACKTLDRASVEVRLVGPCLLSRGAVEKLSRISELTGTLPRSDIGAEHEWADVFAFPTLSEGSSNACGEAMAAGLPVVTTPASGLSIEDGVNGVLVEPGDSKILAAVLSELSSDPGRRRRLGRAAYEYAASAMSLDHYMQGLESVIRLSLRKVQ